MKKDVKRRLHDVPLHNVNFLQPGNIQKRTRTFDTGFKEHDQSVVINAHQPFPFYGSAKKF